LGGVGPVTVLLGELAAVVPFVRLIPDSFAMTMCPLEIAAVVDSLL
jgi:hypothetical protein